MQVKVYLANLKLNRIYHFEKQKIIANDYLTQTANYKNVKFRAGNIIIKKEGLSHISVGSPFLRSFN